MNMVREWFDGLVPRERLLVSCAAVFAGCALAWMLLVQPVLTQKARAENRIRDHQLMLVELSQVAGRIGSQPASGTQPAASGQSLVVIIDRSVRERGLSGYLRRNQPDGQSSIRLRLENIPFDQLIEWLAELQERHGLAANSVTIDPATDRGRVDTNLVLVRTGA